MFDVGGQHALDRYRSYLLLLARMQLNPRWTAKIDASDIVQQTLLEAHAHLEDFCGAEAQRAAWLRRVLANNIRDALRAANRQKRQYERELPLEEMLAHSSLRLANCLASEQSSPSQRAIRQEELFRLADTLLALPEAQRESIVLHYLQGWCVAEVAEHLGRSEGAIAGLLHRGLRRIRELMPD
jgi:RNA polymerase sigma-70 factor (ECF subfamily)